MAVEHIVGPVVRRQAAVERARPTTFAVSGGEEPEAAHGREIGQRGADQVGDGVVGVGWHQLAVPQPAGHLDVADEVHGAIDRGRGPQSTRAP